MQTPRTGIFRESAVTFTSVSNNPRLLPAIRLPPKVLILFHQGFGIHFLFHPHFSSSNPMLAGLLTQSNYCWVCTLPPSPAMTSLTFSPTAPTGLLFSSKTPARLPASPKSFCFTISEKRHQPADITEQGVWSH